MKVFINNSMEIRDIINLIENAASDIWYHCTTKDFSSFSISYTANQIGTHLGTLDQAMWRLGDEEGYILKVSVDIQNPIRLEDQGGWYGEEFVQQLRENPLTNGFKWHSSISDMEIRRRLKSLGYDSVIYLNRHEGDAENRQDSIIVFDPSKIKILSKEKINQ